MLFRRKEKRSPLPDGPREEGFDFERIAAFFQGHSRHGFMQIVSDQTWSDLDMDEVFMVADRTCSRIGQQYLYLLLRCIPKDRNRAESMERLISRIQQTPGLAEKIAIQLRKLDKNGAYFLKNLFQLPLLQKPVWYAVVPAMLVTAVLLIVAALAIDPVFFLALLPVVMVNMGIHYWNKNNLLQYANTIPMVVLLGELGESFRNLEIIPRDESFKRISVTFKNLRWQYFFFGLDEKISTELGQVMDYFLDLLKASFCLEFLLLFRFLRKLDTHQAELEALFMAVAEVDVAL